jgi:hypothetical protein
VDIEMSASDLISKKRYQALCNSFNTKDSSNETAKKKINYIRNISNIDVFGDPIQPNWFGVVLTPNELDRYPDANIKSAIQTTPLVTKTPEMTIEPALKNRLPPNMCGSCFPTEGIYRGEGPFVEGEYQYIACGACGVGGCGNSS